MRAFLTAFLVLMGCGLFSDPKPPEKYAPVDYGSGCREIDTGRFVEPEKCGW